MLMRRILYPFSLLYSGLQRLDRVWKERAQYTSPLPVISVGSLSAGGSGKTPLCIQIIQQLQVRYHCILLSRGYGRDADQDVVWESHDALPNANVIGDEPALMAGVMNNGTIAVSTRRARLLSKIDRKYPESMVLLDDGFQHYGLARDLDILILDDSAATLPRVLPVGMLREHPRAISRADIILVYSDLGGDLRYNGNPIMLGFFK